MGGSRVPVFDSQLPSQIIAEMDFAVISESRLSVSTEEEEDVSRHLNQLNVSECPIQFVQQKRSTVADSHAVSFVVLIMSESFAVNGFTKSVLQCDGHSGLLNLQEQVVRDLSLPTQVSPPCSRQSQGTVERFRKTLHGQARATRIGLAV